LKQKVTEKRNRMVRFLVCLLMLGIFVIGNYLPVKAMLDFMVTPIFPENQREIIGNFFDLIMEPGSEQIIEIEIYNGSSETRTYLIDVTIATTSNGGAINYHTVEGVLPDSTMGFTLEELVSVSPDVMIESGESVRVPIIITMPAEEFDGVIALGITVDGGVVEEEEIELPDVGSGMVISHEFATSMALLIRQTEERVDPDLALLDVRANQWDHRNVITATLQNFERAFVHQMYANATVRAVGETEILYERSASMMQMAPNSNFDFGIHLDGEAFVAGEYAFRIEINSDNGDWVFERNFTITSDEADYFNATDLSIPRTPLWIFIAGGAVLLLILTLIFIRIFKGKTKKTQKQLIDDIMKDL